MKSSVEQKTLAKALDRLAVKLGDAYRAPNDNDHRFEQTGWLLLRVAVAMIDSGDKAFALAGDWAARGFPAGSDDPPARNRDPEALTSVEAASQQSDEWERRHQQLGLLRKWLADNAADIESQIIDTITVRPNEGRRDSLIPCGNPRTDAAGELVCKNKVTGFGEDRLKDGRCPRCYKFRQRTSLEWNPRLDELVEESA